MDRCVAVSTLPRYFLRMNNDPKKPLSISITGVLTIAHEEWERLMKQFPIASRTSETPPQARSLKVPEGDGKLPRLAFSVKETAEMLGISQPTAYRLLDRGLLKSSLALRRKLVSRSEIERFLRETSSEA